MQQTSLAGGIGRGRRAGGQSGVLDLGLKWAAEIGDNAQSMSMEISSRNWVRASINRERRQPNQGSVRLGAACGTSSFSRCPLMNHNDSTSPVSSLLLLPSNVNEISGAPMRDASRTRKPSDSSYKGGRKGISTEALPHMMLVSSSVALCTTRDYWQNSKKYQQNKSQTQNIQRPMRSSKR